LTLLQQFLRAIRQYEASSSFSSTVSRRKGRVTQSTFHRQHCAQLKSKSAEADFEVFRPAGVTSCTDGV